jgi:hypothetical protein
MGSKNRAVILFTMFERYARLRGTSPLIAEGTPTCQDRLLHSLDFSLVCLSHAVICLIAKLKASEMDYRWSASAADLKHNARKTNASRKQVRQIVPGWRAEVRRRALQELPRRSSASSNAAEFWMKICRMDRDD